MDYKYGYLLQYRLFYTTWFEKLLYWNYRYDYLTHYLFFFIPQVSQKIFQLHIWKFNSPKYLSHTRTHGRADFRWLDDDLAWRWRHRLLLNVKCYWFQTAWLHSDVMTTTLVTMECYLGMLLWNVTLKSYFVLGFMITSQVPSSLGHHHLVLQLSIIWSHDWSPSGPTITIWSHDHHLVPRSPSGPTNPRRRCRHRPTSGAIVTNHNTGVWLVKLYCRFGLGYSGLT